MVRMSLSEVPYCTLYDSLNIGHFGQIPMSYTRHYPKPTNEIKKSSVDDLHQKNCFFFFSFFAFLNLLSYFFDNMFAVSISRIQMNHYRINTRHPKKSCSPKKKWNTSTQGTKSFGAQFLVPCPMVPKHFGTLPQGKLSNARAKRFK